MARLKTTRPRFSRWSLTSSEPEPLSKCSSSRRDSPSHGLYNPRRTDSNFHPSVLIAGDPYHRESSGASLPCTRLTRENHGQKENAQYQDEIKEGLEEGRQAYQCTEP